MNPAADVLAAGEPVEVDLSKVQPGQQIIVLWRGKPIFVVDRTPSLLKMLQDPKLVDRLSDPDSTANQQPPYARNWHRSIDAKYAVLVGICTHLGCIPSFFPNPDPTNPAARLAWRVFLPLSRVEIRSGRPGLQIGSSTLQSAGSALSLSEQGDVAHRGKPPIPAMGFQFDRTGLIAGDRRNQPLIGNRPAATERPGIPPVPRVVFRATTRQRCGVQAERSAIGGACRRLRR